jgi:hypothetical protein
VRADLQLALRALAAVGAADRDAGAAHHEEQVGDVEIDRRPTFGAEPVDEPGALLGGGLLGGLALGGFAASVFGPLGGAVTSARARSRTSRSCGGA